MKKLLIVDDESSILASLYFAFEDKFSVFTARDPDSAYEVLAREGIDLMLLDQRLGIYSGLDLLKRVKKDYPDIIVIAITAYGSIEQSVEAMKSGAYYYATKPLEINSLTILMNKALEFRELNTKVEDLTKQIEIIKKGSSIVTNSQTMFDVIRLIDRIKDININVLISGESGTGKEVIAKYIHEESNRRHGPLEIINCAAIPNTLLESELFGYEKGAFTGALSRKKGKIELAHQGTLFLDEIGDMDLQLQAKLLRVVQSKEITPLGGSTSIPVDFRLVAATNRDLLQDTADGRFREDLYFRLKEASIELPPLRDRKEDIPVLSTYFVDKYKSLFNREISGFSKEAMEILYEYPWPGNVRELENIVKLAVALSAGDLICADDLSANIRSSHHEGDRDCFKVEKNHDLKIEIPYGTTIDEAVKNLIMFTLENTGNNKRKTAGILGISERQIHNKIKDYEG